MGEPRAPTLGKGKDRAIPLLCWPSMRAGSIQLLVEGVGWYYGEIQGGCIGVPSPPPHQAHHPCGTMHSAGKQVVMLPSLHRGFSTSKSPGEGGREGAEQGPHSCPHLTSASEHRVSRAGSLAGGGQRQQAGRRRRISLSGCFLKITLPLSAGQGCSRLNNRSRPALPCSWRSLAAPAWDALGSCWTTAPSPASLSPGVEHLPGHTMLCIPHSPSPQNPAPKVLPVGMPRARIPRAWEGITGGAAGGIEARRDGAVGHLPKQLTHSIITP